MNRKRASIKLIAAGLALTLLSGGCTYETLASSVPAPTEKAISAPTLESTPTSEPTPTPHPAVTQIAAGYDCFFILCEDGSVWAWGKNQYGQLGDGTTEDHWSFVKTMEGVKKITPYFAIKNDDSLWVWGNGDFPLHRNGSTLWSWGGESPAPRQIMTDVKDANMGLILKTDGTLWAWGSGRFTFGDGWIGNQDWLFGNQNMYDYPVYSMNNPIKIMDDVESIPQTEGQTFIAVKTDGSLWLWGDTGLEKYPEDMSMDPWETETVMERETGRWYLATTLLTPEKILDGVQSAVILNGGLRSAIVALKTDGTMLGWGEGFDNYDGVKSIVMGETTGTVSKFPEIMSLPGIKARMITGYGSEFYCVTEDGQLLWNGMAPLATDVVTAAAGPAGVLTLKSDGSLWMNGEFDGAPDPLGYGSEKPMNLNMVSETEWNSGAVPVSYPDAFGVRNGWALTARIRTGDFGDVYVVSFDVCGDRKDLFTSSNLGYGFDSPMVNLGQSYHTVFYIKYAELMDAFSRKIICHQYITGMPVLVKEGEDFFLPDEEVSFSMLRIYSLSEYIEEYGAGQSIDLPEIITVAELENLYYRIVPEEYRYYTLSTEPAFTPLPEPTPTPSYIISHRTDSKIPRDRDDELIWDKFIDAAVFEYENGMVKVVFAESCLDENNIPYPKDLFTGEVMFEPYSDQLSEGFMKIMGCYEQPVQFRFFDTWEEFVTLPFTAPVRDALLNLQPTSLQSTDTIGYMRKIYEMLDDQYWYIPPAK